MNRITRYFGPKGSPEDPLRKPLQENIFREGGGTFGDPEVISSTFLHEGVSVGTEQRLGERQLGTFNEKRESFNDHPEDRTEHRGLFAGVGEKLSSVGECISNLPVGRAAGVVKDGLTSSKAKLVVWFGGSVGIGEAIAYGVVKLLYNSPTGAESTPAPTNSSIIPVTPPKTESHTAEVAIMYSAGAFVGLLGAAAVLTCVKRRRENLALAVRADMQNIEKWGGLSSIQVPLHDETEEENSSIIREEGAQ